MRLRSVVSHLRSQQRTIVECCRLVADRFVVQRGEAIQLGIAWLLVVDRSLHASGVDINDTVRDRDRLFYRPEVVLCGSQLFATG